MGYELKRNGRCFDFHCLRSLAVHRSSKGTKTDTDNPNQSYPDQSHGSGVSSAKIPFLVSLHTRVRGHIQVGVFAQGLSFIVHIKNDKDMPSSAHWNRKGRLGMKGRVG